LAVVSEQITGSGLLNRVGHTLSIRHIPNKKAATDNIVTKAQVKFNGDDPKGKSENELSDQHAGEHAHHERHYFIRTSPQKVNRIIDGLREGKSPLSNPGFRYASARLLADQTEGPIRYGHIIPLSSCSTIWHCHTN
jgi:hypothetical protein